jgi:hypothetical protein
MNGFGNDPKDFATAAKWFALAAPAELWTGGGSAWLPYIKEVGVSLKTASKLLPYTVEPSLTVTDKCASLLRS